VCLVIPDVGLNLLAANFLLQVLGMFQINGLCEICCFSKTCKLLTKVCFAYHYNIENSEICYHVELVEKHNSTEHVENHNNSNGNV